MSGNNNDGREKENFFLKEFDESAGANCGTQRTFSLVLFFIMSLSLSAGFFLSTVEVSELKQIAK